MQEADTTASEWQPVATDVTEPDFTVNKISPRKDYNFRIRAELENGDVSEPTPPIHYHRSKLPMTREPFALAEYKPVEYDVSFANRTYVEHLTKFVPPRLPIDKPDMVAINPETVELSWKPARIPDSIKYTSNLTYTIEVRTPPSFEWRELVSGLKVLNHTVKNLHTRIDYVFRVRAWNEYGSSEPSLPVSFYRPIQHEEEEDDEEWEREWDLCYGHSVPPKLPMDTPKVITQLPDSLWFSWLPARIPAYATQTPITYVVEMKEPPSTNWRRDVTGLVDCQYIREGLNPTQDYHIRIRAESEFGTSDPTLPIIIQRSRGSRQGSGSGSRPGSRRSSMERDEVSLDTTLDSTLGSLTAGVPPRMSANRPMSTNAAPDRLTLSWSSCRVPSYIKNSHVSYVIEKRELPSHIWLVVARDVAETRYDITGLNPQQDYMFRVRAKNDFGLSEPTLPMTLYRERDDYVPQKIRSRSGSRDSIYARTSWRARRSSSFDHGSMRPTPEPELDSCMTDKIPTQPEYITTTYDTQYGVLGRKGKISLQVRGYPLPTIHWYLGEEKLTYGDRYNTFINPAGAISLEISDVGIDSVGEYKCYAENESGAAVKMVTLELADSPTVLEPMRDELILTHTTGTLTCRVDAFPSPTVKWTKDWRPLVDSTRVKMVHKKPDSFSLEITNALASDAGVYACTIENIAGKITLTSRLSVEDTTPSLQEVKLKSTPIEEQYHILGELGRGKHGVVRRVIEMATGKSYAANFIYVHNRAQKNFFLSEFEVLRSINQMDGVLRLHDAFETDRSLILVTEILTEPELLEKMTTDGDWTEVKVATMVKKLLTVLRELDSLGIVHLDIKPSNVRVCGPEMSDIKLINFGFSRFLVPGEDVMHNYGTVGYASPEQIINDVLESRTDMWTVGVLTYVLLSGQGPFAGSTDAEILTNSMDCKWSFDEKAFEKISKEAQDFISKLLVAYPSDRMSVDECLNHPWLMTESDQKLDMDKIKQFYSAEKLKTETSKVYTVARLQSLSKLLQGTSTLYQPAVDTDSGEIIFPDSDAYGDYLEEDAWYEWQLQYLDDPDTQYFPLHKKSFTVRESKHTSETEGSKQDEKEDKTETEDDSNVMFRNKIQTTTFSVGEDVMFSCTVVSQNEAAVVTWYRDEQLLSEAYRVEQSFNADTGRATLRITNTKDYDAAVYKCVARNKDGRVSCQARLLVGDKPGKPGRPVVTQTSGTEAFLSWTQPLSDGNTYILGYRIDFKKQGDAQWTCGPYITEEYAIVSGLVPSSTYMFRVSCHNKYGTSLFSWASLPVNTLEMDAPSVTIAAYLEPLVQFSSFTKQQLILPAESRRPSLSVADDAKIHEADPTESYTLADTIAKGKYGEYKACTNKTTNQQCVMKIVPYSKDNHAAITSEFDILCTLRQIHIVTVLDSYISGELFYVVFERLSGINVLQYLSLQKSYKEELVSQIVRQILDALQYLQRFKIMHLNLQPSSVVMATRRRPHVKLRDFTLARRIEDDVEVTVPSAGYPDFVAPEVIKGEPVGLNTDLWSVAVLTFTMLGGMSPFGGQNLRETLSRILFGRYKASDLYDNVSKEGVQFINKLLKRLPKNRPTVTKSLDSRWLQLSDSMLKARNSRVFAVERLHDFCRVYTERRTSPEYMDLASVSAADLPKPTAGPVTEPVPRHRARIESTTQRVKPRSKSPVRPIGLDKEKPRSKSPVRPIGLASEAITEEVEPKEAVKKLKNEIATKQKSEVDPMKKGSIDSCNIGAEKIEVDSMKKDSSTAESFKTVGRKGEVDPLKKDSNKAESSKTMAGKQSSQEETAISGNKSVKGDKTVKKEENKPKIEKVKQDATKVKTDKISNDKKKSPEQKHNSNASPKQSATEIKTDKTSSTKSVSDKDTKKSLEQKQKSDSSLKQNAAEIKADKISSTKSISDNGTKKSVEQKQKSNTAPNKEENKEQSPQNKQLDTGNANEKQNKPKESNETDIKPSKNENIESIPKTETPSSMKAASDERLEKMNVSKQETVKSNEQKETDDKASSPKSTEEKVEPTSDASQADKSGSRTLSSGSDISKTTPEAKEVQKESKEDSAKALPQDEITSSSHSDVSKATSEVKGVQKEIKEDSAKALPQAEIASSSHSDISKATPEAKEVQTEIEEDSAKVLPQAEIKPETSIAAEEQTKPKEQPIVKIPEQFDEGKSVEDKAKPLPKESELPKSPDEIPEQLDEGKSVEDKAKPSSEDVDLSKSPDKMPEQLDEGKSVENKAKPSSKDSDLSKSPDEILKQLDESKPVEDKAKSSTKDSDLSKSPDDKKLNQEQNENMALTTSPPNSKSEKDSTENDKSSEQNKIQKSVDPSLNEKISEIVSEKHSISESADNSEVQIESEEGKQKQTDNKEIVESGNTQSETVKQISQNEENESKLTEISKSVAVETPAKSLEAKDSDKSPESVMDNEVKDFKEKEADSKTKEIIDSSSVPKPTDIKTDGAEHSGNKIDEEKTVNESKTESIEDKSESKTQEAASIENTNNAEDKPESQSIISSPSDINASHSEETMDSIKTVENELPEQTLKKVECFKNQEIETQNIESSQVALEDEMKPTQKRVQCSVPETSDGHKQERLSEVVEKMSEVKAKEITNNALNDIANALQNVPSDVSKEIEKKEKSPTPVNEEPVQSQDKPGVLKKVDTKLEELEKSPETLKEDSVTPNKESEVKERIPVEKVASLASENLNESEKELVVNEGKVETQDSVKVEGNTENSSITDIIGSSSNDVSQQEDSVIPESKSETIGEVNVKEVASVASEKLNETGKESVEKETKVETPDSAKEDGNTENSIVKDITGNSSNAVNGKEDSVMPESISEIKECIPVEEAAVSLDSENLNESGKGSVEKEVKPETADSVKVDGNGEKLITKYITGSSSNGVKKDLTAKVTTENAKVEEVGDMNTSENSKTEIVEKPLINGTKIAAKSNEVVPKSVDRTTDKQREIDIPETDKISAIDCGKYLTGDSEIGMNGKHGNHQTKKETTTGEPEDDGTATHTIDDALMFC